MSQKICNTCGGTGRLGPSKRVLVGPNRYETKYDRCFVCNGAGSIYVNDTFVPSPPKPKKSPQATKSNTANKDKGAEQAKATFIVLTALASGYFTYTNTDENWILAVIVGIGAWIITTKWFNTIVFIGFILMVIYMFSGS
jgi:hypothetical protein